MFFLRWLSYIALVSIIIVVSAIEARRVPFISPYFYLCNYDSVANQASSDDVGEVALSISVDGDPEFYVPSQLYTVTVQSSHTFDGFLLTGLYTLATGPATRRTNGSSATTALDASVGGLGQQDLRRAVAALGGRSSGVGGFVCSIVHSHIGHSPRQQLSFVWLAPAAGTGCISFLATASLGSRVLFKDTTVYQLCEQGYAGSTPKLAALYDHGLIFRDDFESSRSFDRRLWQTFDGMEASKQCAVVGYGTSAVACNTSAIRQLVTVPLNLSSASVVQFVIASGGCQLARDSSEELIVFQYSIVDLHSTSGDVGGSPSVETISPPSPTTTGLGLASENTHPLKSCTAWNDVELIKSPTAKGSVELHLVHLPQVARRDAVCLRWLGRSIDHEDRFNGCWALDNVLITNMVSAPSTLQDDFDPFDASNWLFFPGGKIQHGCNAEGSALIFNEDRQVGSFVMSRDLRLNNNMTPSFVQDFDSGLPDQWSIEGGELSQKCGEIHKKQAAVFAGLMKTRRICTPYVDLTETGSVSFYFMFGSKKCSLSNSPVPEKSRVLVYVEDTQRDSQLLLSLTRKGYTEPRVVTLPITPSVRRNHSRICWIQKTHGGIDWDVWAIDSVSLASSIVHTPEVFIQFGLNLNCDSDETPREFNNSIILEYSTDHGVNWFPVYEPCYPGQCQSHIDTTSTLYNGGDWLNWHRQTLPVPTAALTSSTRFRWRQLDNRPSRWAIDNVYIGPCPNGCKGRGRCSETGCQCDDGYDVTLSCSASSQTVLLRTSIVIPITSANDLSTSSSVSSSGAIVSYQCGVLASGKAAIFNQDGRRILETVDMKMTTAKYVKFSVRVGSGSPVGDCPSPEMVDESVLLQYTCNNGIEWKHLQTLTTTLYNQPRIVIVKLPPEVQDEICRIRWWQPMHSGLGRDVWAIDDVSVTGMIYNTVWLNLTDVNSSRQSLDVQHANIGSHCGRQKALVFRDEYETGEGRYVVTNTMQVGPSYVFQFEIVMNCHQGGSLTNLDAPVSLEFSTDYGITWSLVRSGCWPPRTCDEYHMPSVFHASEFPHWKRVTIVLPQSTWSSATRFRLGQDRWTGSNSWAIGSLYIGQQCPEACRGHGLCYNGIQCRCDDLYGGDTCRLLSSLPKGMKSDFSLISETNSIWNEIIGGEVAATGQGCGNIFSGEFVYFYKEGIRRAVTNDIDMTDADFVQFYVQLGGSRNSGKCNGIDDREESVLLLYSINGGINWNLLKELQGADYRKPRFVHVRLPDEAQTPSTRLMWWQPENNGQNVDQWAIDEVTVNGFKNMKLLEDDFDSSVASDEPGSSRIDGWTDGWLTVTEAMVTQFCGSLDNSLMMLPQTNDKVLVTRDMLVREDDVIQFRINVGCSQSFSYQSPVLLQYSHDSGLTWTLVSEPCYLPDHCGQSRERPFTEGSVYHAGPYGEWRTVTIPITSQIASKRTNFRWWQQMETASGFGLDNVYIGPACPHWCLGQGRCVAGHCQCDPGHKGDFCWQSDRPSPTVLVDRFEDVNRPGLMWDKIFGGALGAGCGDIGGGNSLYFDDPGIREARTVSLDTRNIRLIEFRVRIGDNSNPVRCRRPVDRREAVIVDYTSSNGVVWNVLRYLDPYALSDQPQTVIIDLPKGARTNSTVFRWWQPINGPERLRAQWAIDDVIIAINETSRDGFEEDFNPLKSDVWYMVKNAIPKVTCNSRENALEFSKNGEVRYAETWDYKVSLSSFLQFDIAMGCSGTLSTRYSIQLQYSVDSGRNWHPVVEPCASRARYDCSGYHLSNDFLSEVYTNWTRVTLYLPPGSITSSTRFRWIQKTVALRGNIWAIDNVYLGSKCPWMCSGHGYCHEGVCLCDTGFTGEFCIPSKSLPMTLREDFEQGVQRNHWHEVYGADASDICDTVVSGKALTFYKDSIRMAVTRDMDVSMSLYVQFNFLYGCQQDTIAEWLPEHSVLLQYSSNGGILWQFLTEVHYTDTTEPKFISVQLPMPALTNATRFRFWQPQHGGRMRSVWSIDDIYIGGSIMNPDMLYETFDSEPDPEEWPFRPGGSTSEYCTHSTKPETLLSGITAMWFGDRTVGERSITSRDINVNEMSVIQFDINTGCSSESWDIGEIHLEYSLNAGRTWQTVQSPCSAIGDTVFGCSELETPSTVYYSGTSAAWRRVVVPLNSLHVCGVARFRWTQGKVTKSQIDSTQRSPSSWAIDNIFIGMQCQDHCNGHGVCVNGMLCQCDDGYSGDKCTLSATRPNYLKEEFEGDSIRPLDENKWYLNSGGERTDKCGTVLSGKGMHFHGFGERILQTTDLDLVHATVIQFFIKFDCGRSTSSIRPEPVLLQFSVNGGINWITLEQLEFPSKLSAQLIYVTHRIPDKMKQNATRVQWIQPTLNGSYTGDWAIDQIYIGGNDNGVLAIQDSLGSQNNDNWLMYTGARIQQTCSFSIRSLHFAEVDLHRYAVTKDVTVTTSTYVQFYISMGCTYTGRCYGVELQYSLNLGQTWSLVHEPCMMSRNIACTSNREASMFTSDVYYSWTRVTLKLPLQTRSKYTRFRWIQTGSFNSDDKWAITAVYVGDECDCSCAGHGRCDRGRCICDRGWIGPTCAEPSRPLPTHLMETFGNLPDDTNWVSINGGTITRQCGIMSTGTAMHMKGDCTRQLITTDLDLRLAKFIQFYFRFGCAVRSQGPLVRDEGVVVEYSGSAGTIWNTLIELYYDQYKNTSFISVELPKDAKTNGVRIRWWQPQHTGRSRSDWVIDDIVIGGKEVNPNEVNDDFGAGRRTVDWLQLYNVRFGSYCGLQYTAIATAAEDEGVVMTTSDVAVNVGDVIEFSIVIGGCNASWELEILEPVLLQYSTDYGVTWRLMVDECLPFDQDCDGKASTSSVFYPTRGWQRFVIVLNEPVASQATRFRWSQSPTGIDIESAKRLVPIAWALDDVYIGHPCPANCNGHGRCNYPECLCDTGYSGTACDTPLQSHLLQTSFFETFNEGSRDEHWNHVQGGSLGVGCLPLVDGRGLVFTGKGRRQAVTKDLDLRNAKHVQYHASIGGPISNQHCYKPTSKDDDVIVQYSNDAAITWILLHIMDHSIYWNASRHDYITLPTAARTSSTRLRWWQRLPSRVEPRRAVWSLDDVNVGGMDIAPSELYERFDSGTLNQDKWEFHPSGRVVENGACDSQNLGGRVMSWPEGWNSETMKLLTTCQLIVQENFVIQFKIVVGCRHESYICNKDQPVVLEYNKDPSDNRWELVFSRCLPEEGRTSPDCRPYSFRDGTIYSAADYGVWTRVTLAVPSKVYSSQTRFRWRQTNETASSNDEAPNWAIDDVYIGEKCPDMCRGRGDCVRGTCSCDRGYIGPSCEPVPSQLISSLIEGFEGGVLLAAHWSTVSGGSISSGCGSLFPAAHGKTLYFNGCGTRQAVTAEMDLTKASKIMFAMQIGSRRQTSTCNVQLESDLATGKVLLQYTVNKGVDWMLVALHKPQEYLAARKVAYEVPRDARVAGAQFRWWQPDHRGVGRDQWAIDHIEITMTHQDQMLRDVHGGYHSNNARWDADPSRSWRMVT